MIILGCSQHINTQVLANTFRDIYVQFDSAYSAYAAHKTYTVDQLKCTCRAYTLPDAFSWPCLSAVGELSHAVRVRDSALGSALLTLIGDIDEVLATNPNYLLGTWYAGTFPIDHTTILTCGFLPSP